MEQNTRAVRIGMAQILVEGGRPDENLARARQMIARAAAEGCHAVVLPECLDCGWTHPCAHTLAGPIPGAHSAQLAHAARANNIHVVAGLVERDGPRFYNSAVLISPAGETLLKHRKINELDIARDFYSTGDRLGVAHTPLGTIGVNICADNFAESLYLAHSLGAMGARLLLSPCAWAVDADHDNAADRYGPFWERPYAQAAKAHGMTIIGVSNVGWITAGPWQGRKCIGCSLAVGPDGSVLAQGPYGESAEALVVVEVPAPSPITERANVNAEGSSS